MLDVGLLSATHKGCEASARIILQQLHLYAHKKPG